jgi:hypothetical protein
VKPELLESKDRRFDSILTMLCRNIAMSIPSALIRKATKTRATGLLFPIVNNMEFSQLDFEVDANNDKNDHIAMRRRRISAR